ncbi:MAG: hypothetical protein ACREM3_27865, partial [Candidatus Rokuibacteriota bacterium]
ARGDRPAFGLSSRRWGEFYRRDWERRGLVLEQPLAAPLATPAEAFRCLLRASEAYRAGDRSVPLEFCIEHARLLADVAAHLPTDSDGSPAGYAERMTRQLEGRRFGLVVEDFQAFDATLWLRLRQFLRGLFDRTGIPREAAKATLFLGNYRRTPFGLHRGRSSNFMFVVEGRKRILAWPDAFFRGKEDMTNRTDYGRLLPEAITLEGEPGDVIYWPSDYWHIGEDAGGLSAAISVALFMDAGAAGTLTRHAAPLIEHRGAALDRAARFPRSVGRLAAMVERAAGSLRDLDRAPELRRALTASWLNHATGAGFRRVPPPLLDVRLADDDIVTGQPADPILWLRGADREVLCSANGHDFAIAANPRLLRLLERLNAGTPARVAALVAEHAGACRAGGRTFEASPADVRALLEHLCRVRAISAGA